MNINKLRARFVENGLSTEDVARQMGIDRSTLYRKMRGRDGRTTLTISDAQKLAQILGLSPQDINDIFFGGNVA